jgi:2-iminobutanoate/2-iminopropanoate deaminase
MSPVVETSTPPNTPTPIGPYNHIAKVGQFISIGGTAGVDPYRTDCRSGCIFSGQTNPASFRVMLESVDSDLGHTIHINVFLKHMSDFDR